MVELSTQFAEARQYAISLSHSAFNIYAAAVVPGYCASQILEFFNIFHHLSPNHVVYINLICAMTTTLLF